MENQNIEELWKCEQANNDIVFQMDVTISTLGDMVIHDDVLHVRLAESSECVNFNNQASPAIHCGISLGFVTGSHTIFAIEQDRVFKVMFAVFCLPTRCLLPGSS